MKNREPKNENRKPEIYDAIIIGGGPAGMSAALWCDELKLSALLLEKSDELGGQLLRTFNAVENHLGIEAQNGRALRDAFVRQLGARRFELLLGARISGVDLENKTVRLADGRSFSSKAIIIATGVRRRKLDIPGEDEFQNKGFLYSGARDKNTVKDRRVTIVGGGDAALENALILAAEAAEITVVHRRGEFRARPEFLEKARREPKISFLTETVLTRILGAERIEAVETKNLKTGAISLLPTDAVLLRIGVVPNTELFAGQIDLDPNGYIKTDAEARTSIAGIYAAGDAANPAAPTVSSAVGTAATAIKSISAWLSGPYRL